MVVALLLSLSAADRADGAAPGNASVAAAGPAAPGAAARLRTPAGATPKASRRTARRLTPAQKLEQNVRRLTRGLKLDQEQQQKLRQILVDQRRQILALRSRDSNAQADVAGTTLAIYEQTKTRIRAILTEEQKKKYTADVPREGLAPAQADLKHWMDLQESKRRQDEAKGGAK